LFIAHKGSLKPIFLPIAERAFHCLLNLGHGHPWKIQKVDWEKLPASIMTTSGDSMKLVFQGFLTNYNQRSKTAFRLFITEWATLTIPYNTSTGKANFSISIAMPHYFTSR